MTGHISCQDEHSDALNSRITYEREGGSQAVRSTTDTRALAMAPMYIIRKGDLLWLTEEYSLQSIGMFNMICAQ